ncbi:MAG: hypothetical protein ABRQ27_04110 [Clostridiaceae bacterium]
MQTEKSTFSDDNYFYPYADNTYFRNEPDIPNNLDESSPIPDFQQPVDPNTQFTSEPETPFDRQYNPQGHYNYPQHQNMYHSPYHGHYGYYPYYQPYYSYYPYYYPYPGYGYGYNLLPWLLLGAAIH